MRLIVILFFISFCLNAYGQQDTSLTGEKYIEISNFHPDCIHSHICCNVFCYCCTGFPDSLKPIRLFPRYSETIYPQDDGLIYDQYVGEYIAGFNLANGWREDTINGGYNKDIDNPYIESSAFSKHTSSYITAYRYKNGKLYSGKIEDTIMVSFIPDKIRGYFNGQAYYESKYLNVIFRADCVNGMVEGRGVLCGILENFGIYNNIVLSECNFENGEITGLCKNWNLNSIDFEINNKKIFIKESTRDYSELKQLLELTEVTYTRGVSDWVQYKTFVRNKKTGKIKAKSKKHKN